MKKQIYYSILLCLIFCGCKNRKTDLLHEKKDISIIDKIKLSDPLCPNPELITNPKEGTPENIIFQLYAIALKGDTEENFEKFYSFFASTQNKNFVKDQHWPRILNHINKYIENPDKFSYIICKKEIISEDKLKIYVKSNDPTKTHPPILFKKEDNNWVVDIFTP